MKLSANTQTKTTRHAVADRFSRRYHGVAAVVSMLHSRADGDGGEDPYQNANGDSGEGANHTPRGLCDAAMETESPFAR